MDKKECKQLLKENNDDLEKRLNDKFEKKLDVKFKENNKYIEKLFDNRSKMLLEHFEHKLTVIAEVQGEHSKKLDGITEMVAKNSEDIETIKIMLDNKVNVESFDNHEKRIVVLEGKVKSI